MDNLPVEGTFRAHQVPIAAVKTDPAHLAMLQEWMLSYKPDDLFDSDGALMPELAALAPRGDRRMGASPHAPGGRLLVDLDLPDIRDYAVVVTKHGGEQHESTRRLGQMVRDLYTRNAGHANFRLFSPDEANSNRMGDVFTPRLNHSGRGSWYAWSVLVQALGAAVAVAVGAATLNGVAMLKKPSGWQAPLAGANVPVIPSPPRRSVAGQTVQETLRFSSA